MVLKRPHNSFCYKTVRREVPKCTIFQLMKSRWMLPILFIISFIFFNEKE